MKFKHNELVYVPDVSCEIGTIKRVPLGDLCVSGLAVGKDKFPVFKATYENWEILCELYGKRFQAPQCNRKILEAMFKKQEYVLYRTKKGKIKVLSKSDYVKRKSNFENVTIIEA